MKKYLVILCSLVSFSYICTKELNDRNVYAATLSSSIMMFSFIFRLSNFRYYGFHYTKFLRNKRTGEVIHQQILTTTTSPTGYLRSNIAYLIGDLEVLQVKTYRYIYPLCKHFRFIKPEKPYPQYEKGIDPVEWNRDKRKIKENIIMLLDKVAA